MTNFALSQEINGFITPLVKRECMIVYLPLYPMMSHVPNEVLMFPYTYNCTLSEVDNIQAALNKHQAIGYDTYFQVMRNSQKSIAKLMAACTPVIFPLSHVITAEDEKGNVEEVLKNVHFLFGTLFYARYQEETNRGTEVKELYEVCIDGAEVMLKEYKTSPLGLPVAFIPKGQVTPDDERLKKAKAVEN